VPTDAPPLVIAIPGARNPASDELVSIVADAVSMSCPNATIRAGYLEGEADRLDNLLQAGPPDDSPAATAIVIPLLTGPNPRADAALAAAVTGATVPVIATDHLGPHPLIAEAMHARLADAYERAGLWNRAVMHLRAAGNPSEKRVARLRGKIADDMLAEADKRAGSPLILETIVEHFADTDAAEKAKKRLRDQPADGLRPCHLDLVREPHV